MASPLAPYTGFGDYTNTSIKFGILAPNGLIPLWSLEPRTVTIPIPMSNRVITQYGGLGLWSVSFEAYFDTSDELVSIQLVQGKRAALRYQHNTTNNPGGAIETLLDIPYVVLADTLLSSVSALSRDVDGSCTATLRFERSVDSSEYVGW